MDLPTDRMPEAEVSLLLAFHLLSLPLSKGEATVSIDGAHVQVKDRVVFEIVKFLQSHGWALAEQLGSRVWQGRWENEGQFLTVVSTPGIGDVTIDFGTFRVRAECKGGTLIRRTSSPEYAVLRGVLGQIVTTERPRRSDVLVAAVPDSPKFRELANRWRRSKPIADANIQIVLVDRNGSIHGLDPELVPPVEWRKPGKLCFFPWLHLERRIEVGKFEILPYVRGDRSKGYWDAETQTTLDYLLRPYRQGVRASVQHAVVVREKNRPIFAPFEDGEQAFAEVLDLLAFTGISTRWCFQQMRYWNRDNFTFYIQSIGALGGGVSIDSRRRDGSTTCYDPSPFHSESVPRHVHVSDPVIIDIGLLRGLWRQRCEGEDDRFALSLPLFNLANTDSSAASPRQEMILLASAFERLLNCGTKARAFAEALDTSLRPRKTLDRSECDRVSDRRYGKFSTVRAAWAFDFYTARGSLAHGHDEKAFPSAWTQQEHLLLGSYAFPLLVKQALATAGRYGLTQEDDARIEAFERLLVCLPEAAAANYGQVWKKTIGDAMWEIMT